ncbi:unnamed protein product [Brassica oleracea]
MSFFARMQGFLEKSGLYLFFGKKTGLYLLSSKYENLR